MKTLQERIETKLFDSFSPNYLKVINQSNLHVGHMGDDGSGESHFKVEITATEFDKCNKIEAHRRIFNALHDEMQVALAIEVIKKN